jgi:RNA polymerase sigma-70 factor (ECF subfamily)
VTREWTAGGDVTNSAVQLFVVDGMPDSELIARALAGDRAGQDALVERYYDDCWRYAYRLLGERADAEDAVQETFMRAMVALPQYREHQRFRAWLFTILVNQCRNLAVARSRRDRRFQELPADGAGSSLGAVPPTELADDEISSALATLDPLHREAVLLKFGEGLGYADMARLTGASESALKMRVKRGCQRLRALLGPNVTP